MNQSILEAAREILLGEAKLSPSDSPEQALKKFGMDGKYEVGGKMETPKATWRKEPDDTNAKWELTLKFDGYKTPFSLSGQMQDNVVMINGARTTYKNAKAKLQGFLDSVAS